MLNNSLKTILINDFAYQYGKNLTGISILKKIWCFQIEDMAIYYSAMPIFEFLQHIKKKKEKKTLELMMLFEVISILTPSWRLSS